MLLILPKPAAEEITAYTPLAVNLQTYDEISIFKDDENDLFLLQLTMVCNPHVVHQAFHVRTIGVFRSAASCLTLFGKIVDSLDAGDEIFELPMPDLPVASQESPEADAIPHTSQKRSGYN